jgi:hypothetical protein
VNAATAEDISQEVVARALASGVAYQSADDLMRWAGTVAVRLSVDEWRKTRRYVLDGERPDRASRTDVGTQAVHRAQLDEVAAGLSRLSAEQRAAVVSGVAGRDAMTPAESSRAALIRHRARLKLLAWTDGIAAVATRVRLRVRSWFAGGQPALAGLVPYVAAVGLVLPGSAPTPVAAAAGQGAAVMAEAAALRTTPDARSPQPAGGNAGPRARALSARAITGAPHPWDMTTGAQLRQPTGGRAFIGTRETRPNDSLVCVGNAAVIPDTCVGQPLPPVKLP